MIELHRNRLPRWISCYWNYSLAVYEGGRSSAKTKKISGSVPREFTPTKERVLGNVGCNEEPLITCKAGERRIRRPGTQRANCMTEALALAAGDSVAQYGSASALWPSPSNCTQVPNFLASIEFAILKWIGGILPHPQRENECKGADILANSAG